MIGSSKINEQTDDLERLQELFDMGLNNCEISRIYRTNSGEQITRTHISAIRRGKRWNINNRSFLMKHELENQDCIETYLFGNYYKTCIAQIVTDLHIYHIYFTYINSKPILDNNTKLMVEKPLKTDLIEYHTNYILNAVSKNK
jgi:hypothetical protein